MELFKNKPNTGEERKRLRDENAQRIQAKWERLKAQPKEQASATNAFNQRRLEAYLEGKKGSLNYDKPEFLEFPEPSLGQRIAQTKFALNVNLFLNQMKWRLTGSSKINQISRKKEELAVRQSQQEAANQVELPTDIAVAEARIEKQLSAHANEYLQNGAYATQVTAGQHRQSLIALNHRQIEAQARNQQASEGNIDPQHEFLKSQYEATQKIKESPTAEEKIQKLRDFMQSDECFGLNFFREAAKEATHKKPFVAEAAYSGEEEAATENFSHRFKYTKSMGIDHEVSFNISSQDENNIVVKQVPQFNDIRRQIPVYFDLNEILNDLEFQIFIKREQLEKQKPQQPTLERPSDLTANIS
jgi:hypothetical protein